MNVLVTKQNQRRTQQFGIEFEDKLASGWVFSVHEAFRDQLDIGYLNYVDKEQSKELRKKQPLGEDGKVSTVIRQAWSRGVPPTLSFGVGETFFDPAPARNMNWADALKVLKRHVQISEAKPDNEFGGKGWVKFKVNHYESSQIVGTDNRQMSQAEFETFLRFG